MEKINIIPESTVRTFGVQSLADRPNIAATYGEGGLSAAQLKARFDSLCQEIIKKVNSLIDILGSEAAADYVGVNLADFSSLGDVLAAVENGTLASILQAKLPGGTELDSLQSILNDLLSKDAELGELIEKVKRDILKRVAALESRDEIVLTVGNKPSGYAKDETVWSTIGNRPNAYGRYGTLWNALMSEAQSVRTGLDAVYSEAEDTTSKVGLLDRRVTNLEAVNRGVSYLEESVSSVAYEAPIPTHAAPFAHLDRVGGATTRVSKYENILDFSALQGGISGSGGLIVEFNKDTNIITITGYSSGAEAFSFDGDFGTIGHETEDKYLRVEHIGGTTTAPFGSFYFENAMVMGGIGADLPLKGNTETVWEVSDGGFFDEASIAAYNRIGRVNINFGDGFFDNYQIRITLSIKEYSLTENKPTALRVMSKNLVPFPYKHGNGYISGTVTFTFDDEGVITAERTGATGTKAWFVMCDGAPISAGTYTMSGCVGGVLNSNYCFAITTKNNDGTVSNDLAYTDGTKTFTVNNDGVMKLQIVIYENFTGKVVFKPQLERGTTATAYTKPSKTISTTNIPDIEGVMGLSNGEQTKVVGWGQGVPSVGGNYITFTDDGRVLYQKTSYRYTFTGNESFTNYEAGLGGFAVAVNLPLLSPSDLNSVNGICNAYEVVPRGKVDSFNYGFAVASIAYGYMRLYDPDHSDDPAKYFKELFTARYAEGNPIVIEYALATLPDPIDITDRFNGFDGFIEGQGNGSVIVENTAKADLPTTLTYMVSTRGE